eukprot:g40555.t1
MRSVCDFVSVDERVEGGDCALSLFLSIFCECVTVDKREVSCACALSPLLSILFFCCFLDETVYYCAFCGAFALMMDVSLRKLPLRKTDSSRVLEEQKHTFKRNMVMGPTGVERQYRLNCKACGLLMCYRVAPVGKPSKCEPSLTTNCRFTPHPIPSFLSFCVLLRYCYFVKDALVGDPSEVVTSIDESSFPGALVSTSNSSQAEALFPSGGPSSASSSD